MDKSKIQKEFIMPKPCIKCKYYEQPGISPVMICKHPEALFKSDPVTGHNEYFTCAKMRNEYKCGAEGMYFEDANRNTFFVKLKHWFLN